MQKNQKNMLRITEEDIADWELSWEVELVLIMMPSLREHYRQHIRQTLGVQS